LVESIFLANLATHCQSINYNFMKESPERTGVLKNFMQKPSFQQSKLVRLLAIFSTEELQRFKVFIASPYFNTNKNVIALFTYLYPYAPNFSEVSLTAENAYEFVFREKLARAHKKEVIIKLASKLLALAERFLEHQTLQQEPFTGALFRKRWFRMQGQTEWEAAALEDMEMASNALPFHDETYSQSLYLIEYERAKWELATHLIAEKLDLRKLNTSLDDYYLRAKLECLCHITNHFLVSNKAYNTPEIDLINGLIDIRDQALQPITHLWLTALQLLRQPTNSNCFHALKNALQTHQHLLPSLEKQTFFVFLANTARLSFAQPDAYFAELFALYQLQLTTGALLTNDVMAPEAFFNVLSVALRQKEHQWAFEFVQQYSNSIDPSSDKRDDMLSLCHSMVAVAQQRFDAALVLLNTTHFKDVQSKLVERRLRLKIYLEMGYDDLFLDQTNSFRKFLSVNKTLVPPHHADGNRNFIQAILLLFRIKSGHVDQWDGLNTFIDTTPLLPEKNWLEEKLATFK
jgi:hypothetical protein